MTIQPATQGALVGIRVLDFSRIVAGPFATQILGDMGADVVKVEPPGGDDSRAYGTAGGGVRPVFAAYNRNKRGMVLDLKSERGREVAHRLISTADVFVHNYRVGVIEKLGLGYEDVRALNPRLVYCAISAFGGRGPSAEKPAVDLIAQARSGLLSYTGERGREPVRVPVSIGDLTAGMYAALGIVSGLFARARDGLGQKVETSLLESLLSLVSVNLTQCLLTGIPPEPMGTRNGMGQPNQVFRVRDGRVAIAAANDGMFRRFCRGIGRQELAEDPRFATLAARYANRDELTATIEGALDGLTREECIAALEAERVVCAPVQGLDDVAADPQVAAMQAVITVTYDGHEIPVVANPLHFSASGAQPAGSPPKLGEHGNEILAELGYDDAAIEALRSSGTTG
jgi:crotonobetainyl-CoA:carnitine CoA-transferase CaiB-like acyl-CoA transferase